MTESLTETSHSKLTQDQDGETDIQTEIDKQKQTKPLGLLSATVLLLIMGTKVPNPQRPLTLTHSLNVHLCLIASL